MGDAVSDGDPPAESARVLALSDAQYKFGSGPVLCRSIQPVGPVIFDNEPWWHVRAECAYGTRERHGGWHHRELYIIATALGPIRRA